MAQADAVSDVLLELRLVGATKFTHGCCIGADEQAAAYARFYGYRVIGAPGFPEGHAKRSTHVHLNHVTFAVRAPLDRNTLIINNASVMIAAPRTIKQLPRSGTWATIRRARAAGKPLVICWPDGTVSGERMPDA